MSHIMDTLIRDERFNTMVSAIEASNLTDTLTQAGPFTLFAPTDDAFAALPEGKVDQLMADVPSLAKIITYHIVPEQVMSAALDMERRLKTVEGSALTIQTVEGRLHVNDAAIIIADIRADNGVIHVIDAVLLPLQ